MRGQRSVLRLLSLIASTALLSGCADLIRPLEPDSPLPEKPGYGIAFGRIAVMRDGEDRMTSLPSFPRSFGWELVQAETGKKVVVDPLTEHGVFAVPLPAGIYHVTKLRYEDRDGLWEGTLAASFSVKPSSLTYVGTWQITFAGLGPGVPITGRTLNDLKEDRDEFEQRYKISPGSVVITIMETAKEGRLALLKPRAEQ